MFKKKSYKNHFKKYGYAIVRNGYGMSKNAPPVHKMYQYTLALKNGKPDSFVPGAPAYHNDINMNKILIRMLPVMEQLTGLYLFPTYNYFRIYNETSELKRHTDRPSCEVSCSMSLGYGGSSQWPLYVQDRFGNEVAAFLEPGDCLIYRGCELEHWRNKPEEQIEDFSQVFLHYVDQNGPYANNIFDKN